MRTIFRSGQWFTYEMGRNVNLGVPRKVVYLPTKPPSKKQTKRQQARKETKTRSLRLLRFSTTAPAIAQLTINRKQEQIFKLDG